MIFIDCDGVLANTVSLVLEGINADRRASGSSDPACEQDITDFDFRKCQAFTQRESQICYDILGSEGFASRVPEYPGTTALLEGLRSKDRVVCLTAPFPSKDWAHCRASWLSERGFASRDIVQCNDKALLCCQPEDILIDDAIHNIASWPGKRVLVRRPWNKGYAATSCFVLNLPGDLRHDDCNFLDCAFCGPSSRG
jgi:5'(3')-deoxyribonucleotidase